MRKNYIYIIGVALLGLAEGFDAIPRDAIFFLAVVTYLVIIRLIAEKFGKP